MTRGQSDIDRAPNGTTFCLSGTHNWTSRRRAATTCSVRACSTAAPARTSRSRPAVATTSSSSSSRSATTGWATTGCDLRSRPPVDRLGPPRPARARQRHERGRRGREPRRHWSVIGGRYYNNRQEGIGGTGANTTLDGVEIDHNNFTNNTYRKRNIECGFEARRLQVGREQRDGEELASPRQRVPRAVGRHQLAQHRRSSNNQVYNNWNEGIFIEISSGANVHAQHRVRQRWKGFHRNGNGCTWLWGGGITLSSPPTAVTSRFNNVSGNCNGITGTQQNRPDGHPACCTTTTCTTTHVAGPGGKTGAVADNGANLATRNIVVREQHVHEGDGLLSGTMLDNKSGIRFQAYGRLRVSPPAGR